MRTLKTIARLLTKAGASAEEIVHMLHHWGKLDEPVIRKTMMDLNHDVATIETALGKLKRKTSADADLTSDKETDNKVTQSMATTNALTIPSNYAKELITRIKAAGQSDLSAIASTLKSAGLSASEVAAGVQAAGTTTVHDATHALLQAGFKAEDAVKTIGSIWKQPVSVAAQVLQNAGHDVQTAWGVLGTAFKGSEQAVANAVAQVFNPAPASASNTASASATGVTGTASALSSTVGNAVNTVTNAASSAWHDVENWF